MISTLFYPWLFITGAFLFDKIWFDKLWVWFDVIWRVFSASFESDTIFCLHLYSEQFKLRLSTFCATKSIFIIMIDIYRWYGFCNVGADPLLHLSGLWHFWQWEVLQVQPPRFDSCLITSSSHVFTNPESTNLQKF